MESGEGPALQEGVLRLAGPVLPIQQQRGNLRNLPRELADVPQSDAVRERAFLSNLSVGELDRLWNVEALADGKPAPVAMEAHAVGSR